MADRVKTPRDKSRETELPPRVGPVEFGMFGSMVQARCPSELDPLMQRAGGFWKPGSKRWLIEPQRAGSADPRAAAHDRPAVPAGGDESGRPAVIALAAETIVEDASPKHAPIGEIGDYLEIRLRCLYKAIFFPFLIVTALLIAPSARAQQGIPPITTARQNAESFLNRMVRVLVAPTASGASLTGFGFIVGEHATATGGPGFLIVTADHLVRSASNPQGQSSVRVLFYANLTYDVPAEVLDVHLPPPEGDLAVLVVRKRSIPPLAAVAIGSSKALVAGMAAWQLGLPDHWMTPDVAGRFGLQEPMGWLYFDDFDGSPESAGGAVITEFGLAGMVVGQGSQATAPVRVLPVELIIKKLRDWGLLNLSGSRAPP